jgi:hypothetical protein
VDCDYPSEEDRQTVPPQRCGLETGFQTQLFFVRDRTKTQFCSAFAAFAGFCVLRRHVAAPMVDGCN